MKEIEKITELENLQTELISKFRELLYLPINDDTIKKAESDGVEIISEYLRNQIVLDIMNWNDDSKLSETALNIKNSIK